MLSCRPCSPDPHPVQTSRLLKRVLLAATLLSTLSLPAWAKLPEMISGVIRDQQTGEGIEGVRVQQAGTLPLAVTDANGAFVLKLQSDQSPRLQIEKMGFERLEMPLQDDTEKITVGLSPISVYQQETPAAHHQGPPTDLKSAGVLSSSVTGFYQLHQLSLDQGSAHVSGLGINELGVDAQWRLDQWLFNGNYFNFRIPISLANFPYEPAFFANEFQIRLGAAYTFLEGDKLEFAIGPELLYRNASPDNRNNQDKNFIPYTNTHLDYSQHAFALGARAVLGWQISERLSFLPELSLYPVGATWVNDTSSEAHFLLGGNLGASLKFELVPGLSLTGNYTKQLLWSGPALDQGDYFRIGLSLDPWRMIAGLQNQEDK